MPGKFEAMFAPLEKNFVSKVLVDHIMYFLHKTHGKIVEKTFFVCANAEMNINDSKKNI